MVSLWKSSYNDATTITTSTSSSINLSPRRGEREPCAACHSRPAGPSSARPNIISYNAATTTTTTTATTPTTTTNTTITTSHHV